MGFEVLFEAGRRFAEGVVEPRAAGNVQLPTGRIVVGDPRNGAHAALVRRVPPGRSPATISVACMGTDEHRVAAAMLRFRAGAISSWEPALPEGRDPDAPTPDDYFGFGIGSGLACFADASVPLPHDVRPQGSSPALAYPGCAATELPIGNTTISVFSANDGTYASFWGLDATGQPMVLVTDFRVIGTAETRAAELLVQHWPGGSLDEEITRNWEARDIVAPLPDIAMPAAAAATATAPKRKAAAKAKAAAKPKAKAKAKPIEKPKAKAKAAAKPKAKAKAAAKPKPAARKPSPKPAVRKPSPKPAARKPAPKPRRR